MTQILPAFTNQRQGLGPRLAPLRDKAGWIIAFGIVLVGLGIAAFASLFAATLVTVYFVGMGMIAAGVAEIMLGFQAKSWGSFFFWIVLGVVYTVAGIYAFSNPMLTAGVLTFVLGASLVAAGLLRIFLAFQMRAGSAWLWVVLSGVITTLLGAMILQQWPVSSVYVLGAFLCIDLFVAGSAWINLGAMLWRHKLAMNDLSKDTVIPASEFKAGPAATGSGSE